MIERRAYSELRAVRGRHPAFSDRDLEYPLAEGRRAL
jgi:hypothetical protein